MCENTKTTSVLKMQFVKFESIPNKNDRNAPQATKINDTPICEGLCHLPFEGKVL